MQNCASKEIQEQLSNMNAQIASSAFQSEQIVVDRFKIFIHCKCNLLLTYKHKEIYIFQM